MADEGLRELERALAAAPDDGPARLALAHGLARAGRRLEALDALDLRRFGDASFAEARALFDELWRAALARLAPAWTVDLPLRRYLAGLTFDRSGETLLLRSGWSHDGAELVLVDAAMGAVVARTEEAGHTIQVHPIERGAVSYGSGDGGELRLARVRRVGVRVEREVQPFPGRLLDVDPQGERLLLADGAGARVHGWSGLPLTTAPRPAGASADWRRGLLVNCVEVGLAVHGLDGGPSSTIELPAPHRSAQYRYHVAPGVLAGCGRGLFVAHLERGWAVSLDASPTPGRFVGPILAGDGGRSLRVLLDGRPVRFDVDLERGRAGDPPPPASGRRDGGKVVVGRGPLHPRADAWVLKRSARGAPRPCVEAFDRSLLAELPLGAHPWAWSPDGRALAVTTGERGDRARLEVWRVG